MVCQGTTSGGVRCGYLYTNTWCPAHEDQQQLWHLNLWCRADRGDGHPCTRERVPGSQFCDIAHHSNGEPCDIFHCNLLAVRRGKCNKHIAQCAGEVFENGFWRRCAADAVENGYCSWNHDPQFPQLIKPQQLRMNFNRDDVIESLPLYDAYTHEPFYQDIHVDHIVELQMHAHVVNTWWKEFDHICEEHAKDLWQAVRTIANKRRNLALTNAETNLLKADGCRRLIQARCYGDMGMNFTDHLVEARSSRFRGSSLDHDDARNIRDALKLELKRVGRDLENESDGSIAYDELIDHYRSFRLDLNGRACDVIAIITTAAFSCEFRSFVKV